MILETSQNSKILLNMKFKLDNLIFWQNISNHFWNFFENFLLKTCRHQEIKVTELILGWFWVVEVVWRGFFSLILKPHSACCHCLIKILLDFWMILKCHKCSLKKTKISQGQANLDLAGSQQHPIEQSNNHTIEGQSKSLEVTQGQNSTFIYKRKVFTYII